MRTFRLESLIAAGGDQQIGRLIERVTRDDEACRVAQLAGDASLRREKLCKPRRAEAAPIAGAEGKRRHRSPDDRRVGNCRAAEARSVLETSGEQRFDGRLSR